MKKLSNLIVLFVGVALWANPTPSGKYTKQKTIQKSVAVNANSNLEVDTKYGNVMVTTWDQNTIDFEVVIKLSSDDEKWVDTRLEEITVDFSGSKSTYAAKTMFGKPSKSGKNSSMEINYTIKIPKNGNLKVTNHYGGIITHDLQGETDLVCKYGKISLGKLLNAKNSIKMDYCTKSSIEYLKGGDIHARYSGLTIGDFQSVQVNSGYSDVTTKSGERLIFKSNYGKINIEKVSFLDISGNYLTLKIGEIGKSLKVSTNYSNFNLDMISAQAKTIDINANYTNIRLTHAPGFAYDFSIATKYGNFKTEVPLEYNSRIETPTSKSYSGFFKKSGEGQISINSNYGNVQLIMQ
jgi:hypothetical protein